jgi:hypothetical protein
MRELIPSKKAAMPSTPETAPSLKGSKNTLSAAASKKEFSMFTNL